MKDTQSNKNKDSRLKLCKKPIINFMTIIESLRQTIEPAESELQIDEKSGIEPESATDQNDFEDLNQIDIDLCLKPQTSSVRGRFHYVKI